MITFKSGRKNKIEIPSNWNDLTVSQFKKIIASKSEEQIIEAITGIDYENSVQFLPFIGFAKEKFDSSTIESSYFFTFRNQTFEVPDIKQKSFGQKIIAQKIIKPQKDKDFEMQTAVDLVANYMMPICTKRKFDKEEVNEFKIKLESCSFIHIFEVFLNIADQLKSIIEKESKVLSFSPTTEQIQAGIKSFDILGEFNAIDNIAKGDPLKYEKLLELDYNTIFLKLLKSNLSSKFERKYNDVLRSKKKT